MWNRLLGLIVCTCRGTIQEKSAFLLKNTQMCEKTQRDQVENWRKRAYTEGNKEKEAFPMGKFVILKTKTGYTFHLKAANGEVIGTSEVYKMCIRDSPAAGPARGLHPPGGRGRAAGHRAQKQFRRHGHRGRHGGRAPGPYGPGAAPIAE